MKKQLVLECKRLSGPVRYLKNPNCFDDFSVSPLTALTESINMAYRYDDNRLGRMNGHFDGAALETWFRERDDMVDVKLVEV